MVVVDERSVRATMEQRGRRTVLVIELRDLKKDQRERVSRSLQGFALGLWARLDAERN